ncbi:Alpha/beta hydrolase family protein [Sulfitobacter sp. THAF37]|uniref:alpha/beta fold hydrolase n=1 Tax=Sulfitobacter sp. THAF37 TaxID=2587855 RepID=UPI001268B0D3|nr:alpha/beta hydrolase [Sulfitobacter sp. THAF37]QFT57192.1 Alpha/beta hydrolase family protein [Sulfitobacter sp. THAF37]
MTETAFLETKSGRKLAYHRTEGSGPCIVFLGGLKSDMMGTKAVFLEDWARRSGRAFLRFDYSGHGESSGEFTDGCIGDWAEDTAEVVAALTDGPILPVGSSMGGWQALLLARAQPERLAGLVTIAAAPDFTEDGYWAGFTPAQRARIEAGQTVELPSDYMEPYQVTPRMITDGRSQLVLRSPLHLPFPTRFLQGTADTAVSVATATRLLEHATGPDMRLLLVKDADHRFSDSPCLDLIVQAIDEVLSSSG